MPKLSKKDVEIRHFWADHLEGLHGIEWEQTDSVLCNQNGFCCLGVAGAIGIAEDDDDAWGGFESDHTMVRPFAGYDNDELSDFSTLNDDLHCDFETIADLIRLSTLPENYRIPIIDLYEEKYCTFDDFYDLDDLDD